MTDPRPEPAPPDLSKQAEPQPALNLPPVIVVLLIVLVGVHLVREFVLTRGQDVWTLVNFAVFGDRPTDLYLLPGVEVWSFLSYALLHADYGHLAVNAVWLAAFGSPLARRIGGGRFLIFSALCAIAGAGAYLLVNPDSPWPMVGASAAISGHMAGAARFIFNGPRGYAGMQAAMEAPASTLAGMFADPRILVFIGVWFVLNLAVGLLGGIGTFGGGIAWEAHIGGFVAGLLLFPLFDRAPRLNVGRGGE
jgi:membrane associated rhomboid family serine protease